MLEQERIKEAQTNVRGYLHDGLLKKEPPKEIVFTTYLRNHHESLALADHIHASNKSNLWTVVISYYSMYYLANAVLIRLGYKVDAKISHKITADALIDLVRNKLTASLLEEYEKARDEALALAGTKADTLIESFDQERKKRSLFQYETTDDIKRNKAETSLRRAKEFSLELQKLLE